MKLFDCHCDTLTLCERHGHSLLSNPFDLDVQRAAKHYAAFCQAAAIYIPDDTPNAWGYTRRVLAFLENEASRSSSFVIAKSASDLFSTERNGGCAVLAAIENAAAIEGDLSRLRLLADHHIVYLTITWNGSNALGNGCLAADSGGLTRLGKQAIDELYRLHILPDVSHLNEAGFWDVAAISNGRPFIASHSVSKAVCDHPRNLSDDQFRAIRDSGGLVGLNLCRSQLGQQSFECLQRHLEHFLSLDGADTVALGMDLDGTDIPKEWGGIAVGAAFFAYLEQKNYSKLLLDKIFFKNSQAFFAKTLTSKKECIRIGT